MKTVREIISGSARVPRAVFGVAPNTRGDLGEISGKKFSAGRLVGAFSSGFVGMAWTPDPINTTANALVRTGTAMGGVLAGSMWKEFQPDLSKLASSIFRRPPKATPAPGAPKP